MEQPDVEFVATNLFGYRQTGKRILTVMTVTFGGNDGSPTFDGENYNALFGNTIQGNGKQYAFITASDYGLDFGGSPENVTEFTIGAFLNLNHSRNTDECVWTLLVISSPTGSQLTTGGGASGPTRRKLCFFLSDDGYPRKLKLRYNVGGSENYKELSELDKSGWAHFAVTYDRTYIRFYKNGVLGISESVPNWQVNGKRCPHFHYQLLILYKIVSFHSLYLPI